jgi:hypothetical protein
MYSYRAKYIKHGGKNNANIRFGGSGVINDEDATGDA